MSALRRKGFLLSILMWPEAHPEHCGWIDMPESCLIKFNWIFLASVCLFTLAMGIFAAQPWGDNYAYSKLTDFLSLSGLLLWTISPYCGMAIALLIFSRKNILIRTFSICMLVISFFSVFILFDTMFVHIDAQGGLVFLFLPVYQWIAFLVLLIICGIVHKLTKKTN